MAESRDKIVRESFLRYLNREYKECSLKELARGMGLIEEEVPAFSLFEVHLFPGCSLTFMIYNSDNDDRTSG